MSVASSPGAAASSDDLLRSDRLPVEADWVIEGQLVEASNLVLRLVTSTAEAPDERPRAVLKPTMGERPLSDFPSGTLAHREVATWLVAHAAGWGCVPETRWYAGDFGEGSLQRWVGPLVPAQQGHVELIPAADVTQAHLAVAVFDSEDGPVVLTHRDTPTLRRIALLDVITNNADRKGSHLVEVGEELYGIDHGLTFHVEEKLRTVLWGFAGSDLSDDETEGLRRLLTHRDSLTRRLLEHLQPGELEAFFARVGALLTAGRFPMPPHERYGLPWPPL